VKTSQGFLAKEKDKEQFPDDSTTDEKQVKDAGIALTPPGRSPARFQSTYVNAYQIRASRAQGGQMAIKTGCDAAGEFFAPAKIQFSSWLDKASQTFGFTVSERKWDERKGLWELQAIPAKRAADLLFDWYGIDITSRIRGAQ
jgi:hypothetical protein